MTATSALQHVCVRGIVLAFTSVPVHMVTVIANLDLCKLYRSVNFLL